MTKSDLVEKIAGKTDAFTKTEIEIMVNAVFDSMTQALVEGGKVEIRGFGSFKLKNRAARDGRNPKSGEAIRIPPKKVPFFKVGKELREKLNG